MNYRILTALLMLTGGFATQAQMKHRCGTDDLYVERAAKQNPNLTKEVEQLQTEAVKNAKYNAGTRGTIRIIPVVFHVLHEYGTENISRDQILDQMRILNEDFGRKNADKSKTRSIFSGVAADCEVEFRLATIDPSGNCTDGINRIVSNLTNDADQNSQDFKKVSYWDSKKYLNVWVVKSISDDGTGWITLGYAQFPGSGWGPASTDGVTCRADYLGSIGTAAIQDSKGRVLTHEVGHWLGLFHTFQGSCTGSGPIVEGISDTPPCSTATNGCPSSRNSCTNDFPDLPDQTENYMDYSDGVCQNMFSEGQKAVIDQIFNVYRSKLVSVTNQKATGVFDTTNKPLCAPIADFISDFPNVCQGSSMGFKDISWHGKPATYEWSFVNGTPATSSVKNPSIIYNTAGLQAVTLKVINATGSNSITKTFFVNVIPAVSSIKIPFTEGLETANFPYSGWSLTNGAFKWTRTNLATYAGAASLYVFNYNNTEPGDTISFMIAPFDLMNTTQPTLEFYLSHAQRSSMSTDRLRVRVSTDCGFTWKSLYNKASVALANKGIQNSNYKPSSAADWRREVVKMTGLGNVHNAILKFEFISSGEGNNIYIDNINIGNFTNGIVNLPSENRFKLSVFPNPAASAFTVSYELEKAGTATLRMFDMAGREVNLGEPTIFAAGSHSTTISTANLPKGIYLIRLETLAGVASQKVLIE